VLAWRGSEGCDSQVKLDEKEKEEVVERTNGYGIVYLIWASGGIAMLDSLEIGNQTAEYLGLLVSLDRLPVAQCFSEGHLLHARELHCQGWYLRRG
jgi:hypothetical protein